MMLGQNQAPTAVRDPDDGEFTSSERALAGMDQAVRRGFIVSHSMDARRVQETFHSEVNVAALIDLLLARGIFNAAELAEHRQRHAKRIEAERAKSWTGPVLHSVTSDEVAAEPIVLDCTTRYSECGAACCTSYDVLLTADEVRSGAYLWDLGAPYRLMRDGEGRCVYLDAQSLKCNIWDRRPHVCRRYSCADDANIWRDFDQHIVSEERLRRRARKSPDQPESIGEENP
jgi:hypothetical protein